MYLRLDGDKFYFIDGVINTKKETDIKITNEEYNQIFSILSQNKRVVVRKTPQQNVGIFGYLEVKDMINTKIVTEQDNLNAQLLKEEAELKAEVKEQKTLNSELLKQIAEIKKGGR